MTFEVATKFFNYQDLSICIMMIVGMVTFDLSSVYILFINGLMIGGAFKISRLTLI
ncbi:hypothetical protein LAV39_14550 [Bacillus pumilus]|uniref:hypothetical protein n=1 Tax=Bacillus pumilus TaxID=1408 RepID=UPI002B242BE8|nr:hypothetical protein [Bacillus pumilus]MEB2358921.1 hypothetical protein [Bacillus pumilus]